MNSEKGWSPIPFVVLTIIYFIVGFVTTVNGQLQGPLQVSFLARSGELQNTLATLISFAFFLGYLVNSSFAGRCVDKYGYKRTMLLGILLMITGVATYALSAWMVDALDGVISLSNSEIPYGFVIFLLGAFQTGSAAAILQVVINPYVASYPLRGTNSVQRMNINGAINSVATTIAPLFVAGVIFAGVHFDQVTASQLIQPLMIMVGAIFIVLVVTSRLALPDIASTRSHEGVQLTRSLWSFRHLALGVLAIFFYVGAEVAIGVNVNLHAMEMLQEGASLSFFGMPALQIMGVDFGIPALLASLYWGGLMVGRTALSFFNNVSAKWLLVVTSVCAMVLTLISMITNNLWLLVAVGLFHSVMWGAIFTLAVNGLGAYTSRASGLLMMGVFGGAIFTLLQGGLADLFGSWRWSWFLVVFCELMLLYYALFGSRVVDDVENV